MRQMDTLYQIFNFPHYSPSQLAKLINTPELRLPVPCAFKPVQDVSAASVVDLIKGVWVGLLHSH